MKSIQVKILSVICIVILVAASVNVLTQYILSGRIYGFMGGVIEGQVAESGTLVSRAVKAKESDIMNSCILLASQFAANPEVIAAVRGNDKKGIHDALTA